MPPLRHSASAPELRVEPSPRLLVVHIAHENDDGTMPDHFLCGAPIRVLLPSERYAGDATKSECETCNRLDEEWA